MELATIFFLIILILSIIVHEVAHGFAAEMLGDPTARLQGRLTLNPLPHIDPLGSVLLPVLLVFTGSPFLFGWAKPVPYNPYNLRNQRWGEAIVAAAGPGVNIVLALIFGLLVRFGGSVFTPAFLFFVAIIVKVNILLALFNLLPIPPLDGSKLLKTLLPYRAGMAFQRFESSITSQGFIVLFFVLFLFMSVVGKVFETVAGLFFAVLTGLPPTLV